MNHERSKYGAEDVRCGKPLNIMARSWGGGSPD
jgi:hypothetical protein